MESAKSAGQGKASGPGGPGGPGGQGKADAAKVLGRLEQLEKAVAQDSVREVGRKYLSTHFSTRSCITNILQISFSLFNQIL